MPLSINPSVVFCLTLVLAVGQQALAVNDWSVPCTQGKCSWDLPADSGASGTVQIWGPPSSISDITNAAGWQIISNCDPTTTTQNIQLVCRDNNPDCANLFQGHGVVNTIVRLPDNCGPVPFARVAQHQVYQSNLSSLADEAPVHQLVLDTNFAAAGPSQGDVHFYLQVQNMQNSKVVNRRSPRRLRSLARSQNYVHRPVDDKSTAGGTSTTAAVNNVQVAARSNTFNQSISANPILVNFSGQTNLFSDGSGSINLDTDLQVSIGVSAVAAGTIIPPEVTQLGIKFVLNGNADATLSVTGDLSGKVSSGNITLFQTGAPGLSIPGILDIGPKFTLLGEVDANFELQNVNASVGVNYGLGGAFYFPTQGTSNGDGITSSSNQVTFNADTKDGGTLGATAHLIPQVSLGINALDGVASTSVFLDFDASLGLQGTISSAANPQACLAGNADISVDLGAQGSFFGLFEASTGKSVFDKNFQLFQKCFGV